MPNMNDGVTRLIMKCYINELVLIFKALFTLALPFTCVWEKNLVLKIIFSITQKWWIFDEWEGSFWSTDWFITRCALRYTLEYSHFILIFYFICIEMVASFSRLKLVLCYWVNWIDRFVLCVFYPILFCLNCDPPNLYYVPFVTLSLHTWSWYQLAF